MDQRITSISSESKFTTPLIIYKIVSETAFRYSKLILKYLLKKTQFSTILVQRECYDKFLEIATEQEAYKLKIFENNNSTYNGNSNGNNINIDSHQPDLCIIIGGDGTVLWCNNLFHPTQQRPPFLTFNLGTLGYLTYYNCDMYRDILDELLENNKKIISYEKRSTLLCKYITTDRDELDRKKSDGDGYRVEYSVENDNTYNCIALNDIVLERDQRSHLSSLEIYVNNEPMTNLKGDGLIISTSTGSTAYSLSAGGTIIHYDVDCILLNAICPHSLSFRAIAFPKDITIKIVIAAGSYKTKLSCDGIYQEPRNPKQGIEVTLSDKYVNIIILEKFISIPLKVWRQKLIDQLGWNNAFRNIK